LKHDLINVPFPITTFKAKAIGHYPEYKNLEFLVVPDQEVYLRQLEKVADAMLSGQPENIPSEYKKRALTADALKSNSARRSDPVVGSYHHIKTPKNFAPRDYTAVMPAGEPIYTLEIDTDVMKKASVSRADKRTWLDLIAYVSLLPNFRLAFTATDADLEKRGALPNLDTGALKLLANTHQRTAEYRPHLEAMQEILSQAKRVKVLNDGTQLEQSPGSHPHVTIYQCPFDAEYLHQLALKGAKYETPGSVQSILGEAFNPIDRADRGENHLYKLATQVPHPGPVFMATDDRAFLRRINKDSHTSSGDRVNFLTFRGLMEGIMEGVGESPLRRSLNQSFGGYEKTITPEVVLTQLMTQLGDSAGRPDDVKEYLSTHNTGKPAVSFSQAVARGVELIKQLEPQLPTASRAGGV